MIRIYFGNYFSALSDTAWLDAVKGDNLFHGFLEGSINSHSATDYKVHNRIPQATAFVQNQWTEYIDLHHAALDPSVNEMTKAFTDLLGVTHYIQSPTKNGTSLSGGVINALELETEPNEFLGKTKFTDKPIPDSSKAKTPKIYAENRTLALDSSLEIGGYRSFSVTVTSTSPVLDISYASKEVIIPVSETPDTDAIFIALYNPMSYTTATAKVYRSSVTRHEEKGKVHFTHDDFHRRLTTSVLNMESFGWNPLIPGSPHTDNWADETAYPYELKSLVPAPFCPFEPINDVLPRVALDFYNRNRPGDGSDVVWLILNTKTHEYFKCIVLNVTALFLMGKDAVSDNTAKITLGVIEQGSFSDAGIDNPDTLGVLNSLYFTPIIRDYT